MPTKNLLQKKRQKGKFSSIVKVKALHSSWDAKMKVKEREKNAREQERERKDARAAELEVFITYFTVQDTLLMNSLPFQGRRLRREENRKRREENIRKAEVVQKIKASSVKKMTKKQMKRIRKV